MKLAAAALVLAGGVAHAEVKGLQDPANPIKPRSAADPVSR